MAAAATAAAAAAAAAYTAADLLKLQSNIKRDPDGYRDEFLMQYRHYQACLQLFQLKPSGDAREFGEFVSFVAQVSKCYPTTTAAFAPELVALLDAQHARLDAALRRTVVQALILLRNRGQLDPAQLLPLLFRLFGVNDKALRQLLFRHIIADLKAANRQGHRSERLNRQVQAFLYGVLGGDNELAAKKSLAVLSELWRRNIWRDGRTVNCIASAVFHRSPAVMAAALRFFLGQENAANGDGDDDDNDDGGDSDDGGGGGGRKAAAAAAATARVVPSREDVYKATHKGTKSSKKKKQAKLKRVMATLKKAARREAAASGGGGPNGGGDGNFAAIHLLHDPQGFAERLLSRLQASRERWELRLDMMAAVARVVGAHKLLLLNLYPFLQKYVAPHQRDVTAVLAAAVTAAHELVPPDSLAPLLRQLVDQFVHDRARPEVMTVGLKAVRELCLRAPLVMSEELLRDLAEYRRYRGDKAVATAARALVGSFRELNPALLAKKDRGRGADITLGPAAYGVSHAAERLDGAELLEAALAHGSSSDDDEGSGSSEDGSSSGSDLGSDDEEEEGSSESGDASGSDVGSDDEAAAAAAGTSGGGSDDAGDVRSSSTAGSSSSGDEEEDEEGSGDEGDGEVASSGSEEEAASGGRDGEDEGGLRQAAKRPRQQQQRQQPKQEGSLADLKKRLAAAKAAKEGGQQQEQQQDQQQQQQLPIEMTRILGADDFRRIRELKRRALVEAALARHGLKSAAAKQMSEAKRRRLAAAAETEADEALASAAARARAGDATLEADDLRGSHKRRKDKAERLESVMAGREGREAFGARAKLKKTKTGGRSEREKQRAKAMPIAARIQQLRNRSTKARQRSNPRHFKGRVKH